MKFIQEQLGHGSMKITSDVYAHVSKKLSTKNMDKIESYTKNILSSENIFGGNLGAPL